MFVTDPYSRSIIDKYLYIMYTSICFSTPRRFPDGAHSEPTERTATCCSGRQQAMALQAQLMKKMYDELTKGRLHRTRGHSDRGSTRCRHQSQQLIADIGSTAKAKTASAVFVYLWVHPAQQQGGVHRARTCPALCPFCVCVSRPSWHPRSSISIHCAGGVISSHQSKILP